MIGYYKISTIGTDHLEDQGGVCQDHSDVLQMENGYTIAVIADGLGSARKSDIGAKTAVDTVIYFIKKNIRENQNDQFYLKLLEDSYEAAYNCVIKYAKNSGNDPKEYNTTLAAALYDGKTLFYGQCGDGGIVALTYEGDYVCVTSVRKGEAFNETFPLLGGRENWSFGKFDGSVCALTMMTDGIFDIVCHPLLANEVQKINIPFIRRFMDRNILKANDKSDFAALQSGIERFVSGNGLQGVTDDKTIVGLINTAIMPKLKDDEYYKEPDWDSLNQNMKEKLRGRRTGNIGNESVQNDDRIIELQNELAKRTDDLNRSVRQYNESKKVNSFLRKVILVQFAIIVVLVIALSFSVKHNKDPKDKDDSSNSSIASGKEVVPAKKKKTESSPEKADEQPEDGENNASENADDQSADGENNAPENADEQPVDGENNAPENTF